MRFLIRLLPKQTDREGFFSSVKAIGRSLGASVKHARWTSYGALEVDVFAPSAQDVGLFVATVEPLSKVEFVKNLDEPSVFKTKEEILKEAVSYFNAERYWECHETLEGVWRPSKGEERSLVQGIILVCAAQVHQQRGERDVALGIYKRAIPQLVWKAEKYDGIDVSRLRRNVERSLAIGRVTPFKF